MENTEIIATKRTKLYIAALELKLIVTNGNLIWLGGGTAGIPVCPPRTSCQKLDNTIRIISPKAKVTMKKLNPFTLRAGNPMIKDNPAVSRSVRIQMLFPDL